MSITKSRPNRVQVCWMILESHLSFMSGGGVPAIGCGLGRNAVAVFAAVFVEMRGALKKIFKYKVTPN